jgi:hypothetical protein
LEPELELEPVLVLVLERGLEWELEWDMV